MLALTDISLPQLLNLIIFFIVVLSHARFANRWCSEANVEVGASIH
jgi:hypothetical protein